MQVYGASHVYNYIPDYRNNRRLPPEEQIVIGLQVVTNPEYDSYQRATVLNARKLSPDKSQEVSERRFNELIKGKVKFIRGLEIVGHDGELDFDVLYRECPDIGKEVCRVVLSDQLLSEGEQKNFLPESDGASSAPAPTA